MTEIVITPAAERDLEDIWLAIAADNPRAATRIVQAIGSRIDMLGAYPRVGPRRSDIRPHSRILVEPPYLVLYEIRPDAARRPIETVEIVRVIDGRRDLRTLFR
ncbi:MAG TPA: type II toxin-antitoxin system RelE/ParE family toxin [Stellaceae bacterium]